jgi:hypothetical protein
VAFSRGNLESLTHKHIVPKLADATFKGSPFAYWIRENRQVKLGGGMNIVLPLVIKQGNSRWYDTGDVSDIEVLEPFNSAQANWFWLEVPGALYETDIDKNGGPDGVINILEATREWLQETMTEALSSMLYATNASTPKQSPGLQDLYGASGTSYLGLLDTDLSSPASWLTSIVSPLVSGTLDEHEMRRMRGTVTRGASRPNFGLCNFPVYNKIWKLVQQDQRFGMEKIAKIGFDHVMFEDMPIMPDEHASGSGYGTADNWLMFLNMDHIQLYVHENKAFAVRVYDPLPQQQAWIMKILLGASFVTDNRRTHAVMKTINPSV